MRRSIAIAEDLARRELYARAKRSLSVLYWAIIGPLAGQDMLNVGDSKQSAEVYADKALRIAETLAAGDSSNDQARADLVFAYAGMGEALQSTQPAKAGLWYLKSIALAGRMADRDADRNYVAQLDQSLAAVLVRPEQIRERLRRLQEANTIRQEQTRTIAAGPCTDVPDAIVVRFERCRERSRSPGADTPDREFRAVTAPGVQPNVFQPRRKLDPRFHERHFWSTVSCVWRPSCAFGNMVLAHDSRFFNDVALSGHLTTVRAISIVGGRFTWMSATNEVPWEHRFIGQIRVERLTSQLDNDQPNFQMRHIYRPMS